MTGNHPTEEHISGESTTKKALILEAGAGARQTQAHGRGDRADPQAVDRAAWASRKNGSDYILSVLKQGGMRVTLSTRTDTEDLYEEEFEDLLHFSTLEEAEMCLIRLDELLRKFLTEGERVPAERVREVARLGRRRAEMISRNRKVDAKKRQSKEEVAHWFAVWLETPDVFFDWLEVRKQSPEFRERFPQGDDEEEE